MLLDETTVRRTTSIDFTTPRPVARRAGETGAARSTASDGASQLVPLALVSKRSEISRIDVRDAHGDAIPLLTRSFTRLLSATALIELAQQRIDAELTEARLTRVLAAHIARAAVQRSERGGLAEARLIVTGRDLGGQNLYDLLYPDRRIAAILRHDHRFLDLLAWLSGCELLVADVPQADQRRILKVGFDETLGRGEQGWLERAAAELGFRSPTLSAPAPDFGNAVEYHLQAVAPAGVSVLEVTLQGGPPRALLAGAQQPPPSTFRRRGQPSHAVTSSFHLFGDPPPTPNAGVLRMSVQAEPSNATASAVVCTVTAALLWALASSSDEVVGRTESAAAILLAIPAIGAAFVLRAEHPMVVTLIAGMRWLVTGAALLAVMAAATLVVLPTTGDTNHPLPSPLLDNVLRAAAYGATLAAVTAMGARWAAGQRSRQAQRT